MISEEFILNQLQLDLEKSANNIKAIYAELIEASENFQPLSESYKALIKPLKILIRLQIKLITLKKIVTSYCSY